MNKPNSFFWGSLTMLWAASVLPSQAAHIHCFTTTWALNHRVNNPPVPPDADYRVGQQFGQNSTFDFSVTRPSAPGSGVPGCSYEISDVQIVEITFTFNGGFLRDGSMIWNSLDLRDLANNKTLNIPIAGPFTSGVKRL